MVINNNSAIKTPWCCTEKRDAITFIAALAIVIWRRDNCLIFTALQKQDGISTSSFLSQGLHFWCSSYSLMMTTDVWTPVVLKRFKLRLISEEMEMIWQHLWLHWKGPAFIWISLKMNFVSFKCCLIFFLLLSGGARVKSLVKMTLLCIFYYKH